jgi:hypothetical protein
MLACWPSQCALPVVQLRFIVGRATLKMLRRKSKTQFVKQERNTQNTITLLNYLKLIVPQQFCLERKFSLKIFIAI